MTAGLMETMLITATKLNALKNNNGEIDADSKDDEEQLWNTKII